MRKPKRHRSGLVRAIACGVLGATVLASGCGSSSKDLKVDILSPVDGSHMNADHVTVRGTVSPGDATVQVLGRDAQVGNGVFTTSVPLHTGQNAIDVVASRSGSAPVSTSVTVVRPTSHSRRKPHTQTTTVIEPAPQTTPAPTPSGSGDWPGGSGYTVILASEGSETAARSTQSQATATGLDAGVLYSSNFRSLRPGYWVVFSGRFTTEGQASQRAVRARELGYGDAYPRFVSP
jgi:cell division septation protein DedD